MLTSATFPRGRRQKWLMDVHDNRCFFSTNPISCRGTRECNWDVVQDAVLGATTGACAKKIGVNVPHSILAGDFVLMVTCQIEYSLLIQCHTFFCLS